MVHILQLGLRFARTGGVLRVVSVVTAAALASFMMAGAFSLPDALGGMPSSEIGAFIVIGVIGVFGVMPGLLLMMVATRVSADIRDVRLASLRLLGISATRTRAIAAVEVGVLSMVGVALGIATYGLVAGLWLADVLTRMTSLFSGRFELSLGTAAITFVLLSFTSLILGQMGISYLLRPEKARQRRAGGAKVPSIWRLVPYGIAVSLMVYVTFQARPTKWNEAAFLHEEKLVYMLVGGAILGVFGSMVAVPWVIHRWARWRVRRTQSLAGLLTARAILAQPASAIRVAAGLAMASAIVMAGAGYLGMLTATKEYQAEAKAVAVGPISANAYVANRARPLTMQDVTVLATASNSSISLGVTEVWAEEVSPGQQVKQRWPNMVFTAPCAVLEKQLQITCDPRVPFAIAAANNAGDLREWKSVRFGEWRVGMKMSGNSPTFSLGAPVLVGNDSPFFVNGIVVPSEMIAELSDFSIKRVVLWFDLSQRETENVAGTLRTAGYRVDVHELAGYAFVRDVRLALIVVTAIMVSAALIAVLIGSLDRARERRRAVTALLVVGVRRPTMRWSQFSQVALPLLLGVGLALCAGLLFVVGGAARMEAGSVFALDAVATGTLATVAAIVLGLTLLVAAATVIGVGAKPGPTTLRRE